MAAPVRARVLRLPDDAVVLGLDVKASLKIWLITCNVEMARKFGITWKLNNGRRLVAPTHITAKMIPEVKRTPLVVFPLILYPS